MKTPKFTLFFTILVTISFLVQDTFMHAGLKWLEFLQDSAFVILGAVLGIFSLRLKEANKKPILIDSQKLALEVSQDEKKQLQEKIKTLEAALEKLMK